MNATGMEIVRAMIKDMASRAYMLAYMGDKLADLADSTAFHRIVWTDLPDLKDKTVETNNLLSYLGAGTTYHGLREFERLNDLLIASPELLDTVDKDFELAVNAIREKCDDLQKFKKAFENKMDVSELPTLMESYNPMSVLLVATYDALRDLVNSDTVEAVNVARKSA